MKSKSQMSPDGVFSNDGCLGMGSRGAASKELVVTRITCESLIGMLFASLSAIGSCGCGGQSRPVTVTVESATAIVQVGTTMQFVAFVGGPNGLNNSSVNWTLRCSATSCGAISPTSTRSGTLTTYAAPPTPPAGNLNVTLTATLTSDASKSASATITVPSVAVTLTPATTSVPSGGKQQFTATVIGDSSNGGVTWSLAKSYSCTSDKCAPFGIGLSSRCDSSCGTLSPASTGSTAPVTYTAPATTPSFPPLSSGGHLLLTATSVTNTIVSTSASINLLPISVSVSPTSASVALNATQQFFATVTNDGTNNGVSWTLSQNGAACSPGCGLIAPASTSSGAAATYTPPATAPALPFVTATATSVEDTTKSSSANVALATSSGAVPCSAGTGNESLLKGQYAFLLQGFSQGAVMFAGGSFTADGTGKITGGEEDSNSSQTVLTDVMIDSMASSYAVGPDRRGCLALAISGGGTSYFRFALGSLNSSNIASAGNIVEFGDTMGSSRQPSGTVRLQDPSSFFASQFKGNYTFGLIGAGAMAGTFNSDGISAITSNTIDADLAGTITSNLTSTPGGTFSCCSANGRGTLNLTNSSLGLGTFAIYMINSSEVFLASDIVNGKALVIPSGTTFSQASLSGVSVLRESAQSNIGPIADIATANADGKGTITLNDNQNNVGTFSTNSTAFNYTVASNGRVALSGGSTPPVLYLYGQNQGFLVGTDANATFGTLEPQAAGPFNNASFSGAYAFGTENPSASTVTMESGVVTADGNGNAAGTSDQSSPAGLTQNQSLNFTYLFPANGVGNLGSGTTAILISASKLVFINNTTTTPTITVVEK